jgi:hypothetical protein
MNLVLDISLTFYNEVSNPLFYHILLILLEYLRSIHVFYLKIISRFILLHAQHLYTL